MGGYILRRLIGSLITLFLVISIVFFLIRAVPGDPVRHIVGGQPVSQEVMQNIRAFFGLDKPLLQQYLLFLTQVMRGDFGISFVSRQPTIRVFLEQLPATIELALGGFLVAVILGGILGTLAGLFPNTWLDTFLMFLALIGVSMPTFYSGILLILIFSVWLRWIPILGGGIVGLILPSLATGMWAAGNMARLLRSAILEITVEDYIRTARAKGLPDYAVVLRHTLRNALIPVVTLLGLQLALFFGGAAITETVFARPGIGSLLVNSVLYLDYPMVQLCLLFTTSTYTVLNFIVDLLYGLIDPRIRYN